MVPDGAPRIRTLLVDDERLVRTGLRARLQRTEDFAVVGECASSHEAIEAIARLAPDLIFLDIQMPGGNGFDVMRVLGTVAAPRVIFVTAFAAHAVRAFEAHALDYLLKPFDEQRFALALEHARESLVRRVAGAVAAPPGSSSDSERLAMRVSDRVVIVRIADIDWIEAAGNYVSVHAGRRAWLFRATITAMERRLAGHGFARIHRATLVAVNRVRELRTLASGDVAVTLHDGTELRQSRGCRGALDSALGLGD